MHIHFREVPPDLRVLDEQIITAVLFAHYKSHLAISVMSGSDLEEAKGQALIATDTYAKEAFPGMTIDVRATKEE